MKTLNKSLVVEAALTALFAAAFVMPAVADDAAPAGNGTATPPAPTKAAPAKKSAAKVHCFGINSCKGKSECSVDGKSACNGKNGCKGQGWISLSAKRCAAKKGTVLPAAGAATPAAPVTPAAPAPAPATK